MKGTQEEISKAEDRIRYYEQQDKVMRSEIQRLTRKERTHRLCTRGGLVEHFILEPDLLTDADVYILLPCLRPDWKSSMIKQNPNPSPIEKMWFGLSCFGKGL